MLRGCLFQGPNPWKVAILLEELGLPYETKFIDFADMKKEPYTSINPNGRVPAIEDPNTGITLAEVPPLCRTFMTSRANPRSPPQSGAIIQYLIETYDNTLSLTYTSFPEKYQLLQWLHFQMSGQGPYFGQKAWFSNFHSEKLPSAEARYANEIRRVLGVIDAHLKKHGTEYLVGDKCTFADLAFLSWNSLLGWLVPDLDTAKEVPEFHAWNERLMARPAVRKVFEDKAKANQ
jgi:glutathione S-transferase